MMPTKTRVLIVQKEPNPLFTKWLQERLENAEQKNLLSRNCLKQALESLKKFPLPLSKGRDCAILRGFGPSLCNFLDKKLELHNKGNLLKQNKNDGINYTNIGKVIEKSQTITKQKCNVKKVSKSYISKKFKNKDDHQTIGSDDLKSGIFKVILLVDTQETTGKYKKTSDETKSTLENENIRYEIRRLNVGDFCWICRDNYENEFVLPYIIERKRMDDFASSIKDGRFHEQKFRLRDCGLKNLIYLIENYGDKEFYAGLRMKTLMQAAINTQVHSKFQIKFTDSHRDSLLYICTLTKMLIRKFEDKSLNEIQRIVNESFRSKTDEFELMRFKEFSERSVRSKQPHIKTIFLKQLLQLKSLSIDKALSIAKIYPTPYSLLFAYKSSTREEAEKLLENIPTKKPRKTVGALISRVTNQFYNTNFNN